jgi:hypothetical protein
MLQALIVFSAMVAVDYFFGKYTIAAAAREPGRASFWAVGIIFANSIVVIEYVGNHWLILAAAAGSALGTYLSVRKTKNEQQPGA